MATWHLAITFLFFASVWWWWWCWLVPLVVSCCVGVGVDVVLVVVSFCVLLCSVQLLMTLHSFVHAPPCATLVIRLLTP